MKTGVLYNIVICMEISQESLRNDLYSTQKTPFGFKFLNFGKRFSDYLFSESHTLSTGRSAWYTYLVLVDKILVLFSRDGFRQIRYFCD